jgi:outer membrane protein OmpA-like peptidoglycan-associated protein
MSRYIIFFATMVLLTCSAAFSQSGSGIASTNVAYWVDYWSRPRVNLFGPDEEAFNQNMQDILFPWNDHDDPSNPDALESNARWLKDHPDVFFYIDGYASSRGDDMIYNLRLAQRRAEWVRQALVSRGISESRIKIAAGWGQLYPTCPELNDECWSKNRIVRFVYAPN